MRQQLLQRLLLSLMILTMAWALTDIVFSQATPIDASARTTITEER